MQVYRGFDAGTGKPSAGLRARVPHHLIDVADPRSDFNLGDYVRLAEEAIARIRAAGRRPVIVGGTGLYLQGLLRGVFDGPRRDEALRERLARTAQRHPGDGLHRMLRRVDPAAATRLSPRDTQRIVRGLEVYFATGRPMTEHLASHGFGEDRWSSVKIGLMVPRPLLASRITSRVGEFLASGWEDEVRALLASGVPEEANAWKALGYRQILGLIRGTRNAAEARESIEKETRQYAKRQTTWFRKEPGVHWFEHSGEPSWTAIEALIAGVVY
jgi:tRNA dimethylallyltransferase